MGCCRTCSGRPKSSCAMQPAPHHGKWVPIGQIAARCVVVRCRDRQSNAVCRTRATSPIATLSICALGAGCVSATVCTVIVINRCWRRCWRRCRRRCRRRCWRVIAAAGNSTPTAVCRTRATTPIATRSVHTIGAGCVSATVCTVIVINVWVQSPCGVKRHALSYCEQE